MPSHRRRTNRGADDQQHAPRGDESHADPYSRLANESRQPANYRRTESTTSTSGRHSYDMSRASSSRTHRDSDWRPKDAENRYGAQRTNYHRRDDYEMPKPQGSGSWPAHNDSESRYPDRVSRDWPPYEPDYSTSSYPESWNAPVEHQSNHHQQQQDGWQTNDYHGHGHGHVRATSYKERPPERVVETRREWTHDQRRGKDGEKWGNGSGWADRGHTAAADHRDSWYNQSHQPHQPHHSPSWSSPPSKKEVMDDRSWEPAESWKTRSQNGSRHDYSTYTRPPATGRRTTNTNHHHSNYRNYGHANNYSQRDWRNDDGANLNNWNRRASQSSERAAETTSPPRPRKHRGRSASHSPAESYYSRRSSRGRTKSPSSPASKRRRRDSRSPASHAEQAPSREPSYPAWEPHQDHTALSQPSEPYQHNITRRDASPDSSRSTGRSPSRSYSPNTELQHQFAPRIPSSASAPAIISRSEVDATQTTSDPRRNGTNGVHHQRGVRAQPLSHTESIEAMPPPAIIPAAHYPRPADEPLPLPKLPMGTTRILARPSSFKPIGQNSSSLRRFFPGDDEDMDISSDLSVSEPQEPPSQPNVRSSPLPHPSNMPSAEPEPLPPRLPSSPLAPSRASSVVMEEESTEPEPVPVPVPQQPQTDTGASTPSVRTRNELYALVSQVGEGTFGKVYKAQNTVTKLYVALKRIRMESEKEGFPVTAMREVKLLQSLRHENVVRLYEMMVSNGSVYMVFEYMDHDLTGILSQTQFSFTDSHLKSLCHQMLSGLAYLHHKGVIHRDIKGSNILLNNRGELKLADFGLARFYQKRRRSDYTNRVITLWYRPPELLLGATVYGPEVDMWSAGCIMLELFTKKPVFQGDDEIHQLDTIYRVIGTPTVDRWPDMTTLPWFELVKPKGEPIPNHFREMFCKWMSPAALDLAEWLLCYDPAARATATQAMVASYFTQEEPPACAPVGLATIHGEWHELETKRERAKKRRRNDSIQ